MAYVIQILIHQKFQNVNVHLVLVALDVSSKVAHSWAHFTHMDVVVLEPVILLLEDVIVSMVDLEMIAQVSFNCLNAIWFYKKCNKILTSAIFYFPQIFN